MLLAIVSVPSVWAQDYQINLDSQLGQLDLRDNVRLLRTGRNSQLSDLQQIEQWSDDKNIQPLKDGESLWGNLQLKYNDNLPSRYILSIGNPNIDSVDIYVLDGRGRIRNSYSMGAQKSTDLRPFNHRNFLVPLEFSPSEQLNIYFRLIDDGPLVFSLDLFSSDDMISREQVVLIFIGAISGALAILACYFLITYVLLRSPVRFWFAVANISFLVLILNIEGMVSQVTGLSTYISSITTCLIALALFSAAKVSHAMLVEVPAYWRFVSYTISLLLLVSAFVFNAYWQIIVSVGFAGAALGLQLLLAVFFRNKFNSLPNRIYALGWLVISVAAMVSTGLFLIGIILTTAFSLLLTFIMLAGVLLLAVAIEAHEQVVNQKRQTHQQDTIADLHRFYELFRNSAEGLYTSTIDGKLVTTNPAMCALFGYDNEQQMLAEISNTSMFYAHQEDREHLLGEIHHSGVVLGKEIRGMRRDGTEFWFSVSAQLREQQGEKFMFGSIFDITERKQSDISLEYLATHDSLTGIYNRREFERQLRVALQEVQQSNSSLTMLYMDLDQFKVVNDTSGHKAGDVLIKQLSQELNDIVMHKGMMARLGGDEFGVLLVGDSAELAYMLANKLLNLVKEFRFIWENRIFTLGISIGMVNWHAKIKTPEQLLIMADAACYMAKEQGRNQIHTYSPQDANMQRYETELNWVSHINNALDDDKFVLYYQHYHPLAKLVSGHHYEILLRMVDEDGKIVPPSSFLPAAERYSLTAKIDRWVINNYFSWLAENPQHKKELNRGNINLSGHSLADKDLKLFVLNAFEKYGIPYNKICFEITESMAIIKMEETLQFISTFRQLGCTFALDDFGSGFSSYGYLKTLPVDFVKIDGGFVKDILVDKIDMAMVCSINDVAKAMGMETVAEFVESVEIMVQLGKIGVDYAQGYGVAKPAALTEFTAYGRQSSLQKENSIP